MRVWWEEEETWFSGTVDYYNEARGKHRVRYDDGDRRTYDLFGEGVIHPATTHLPHPSSATPFLCHTLPLSHPPFRSATDRPVWEVLSDERGRTPAKLPSSPSPRRRTEATKEGVAATMYSDLLLRALASGPLARGPLLQSAARLGCVKDEHLHRLEECLEQRVEQGLLTLYLGEFQVTLKGRKRLQAMPPAVQSSSVKRRVS